MNDESVGLNHAIAIIAATGGGTLHLEPRVYNLNSPLVRASNVTIAGAFRGAHLFDATVNHGTILRWTNSHAGAVIYDAPIAGDYKIDNGGVKNLSIDGGGMAANGLQSMSAYYAQYKRIHVVGVKSYAFYFGTVPTPVASPNYHCSLEDLTGVLTGGASGIALDGTPGSGRNTCFVSARNCHITYQHGVAYALSNCDDCGFTDCAASRMSDGTGTALYFGGSSDGSGKAAYGNRFIGFKSNGPIVSEGGTDPARGNLVVTNAVDGVPLIYQRSNSTLTVEIYDGEVGFDGLARNPLKKG